MYWLDLLLRYIERSSQKSKSLSPEERGHFFVKTWSKTLERLGKGPDDVDGWGEFRPDVALEFATNAIRGLPTYVKPVAERVGIDIWLAKMFLKELAEEGKAVETLAVKCPTCGYSQSPPDTEDLFLECVACDSGQYIITEEIIAEYTAPQSLEL